jgi:fluoroacetyl-CoA thioesterase
MNFPGIQVGKSYTIRHSVTKTDTYGNHLPDDIQSLLSSPGLTSLMIRASSELLDPLLPDGFMSVGKSVSITHEHPSVVGATVDLTVTIVEFDGYHVSLEMTASDESGLVGTGSHTRSIVNKRWLQIRIHRRIENL